MNLGQCGLGLSSVRLAGAPALDLGLGGGVLDSRLTFARSGTATYWDDDGNIAIAADGDARLELSPHTGRKGLLIEGARTNTLVRSAEMGDASWVTSNASVTVDQATAPDGATDADLVTATASSVNAQVTQNFASTAAAWTFSVFLKQGTSADAEVGIIDQGTASTRIRLTFATGTAAIAAGTPDDYGVEAYAGGWYRVWLSYTFPVIGAADTVAIYVGQAGASVDTETVYAWGAQVEAAEFPSSYIPTTTVAVTRAAESCTYTLPTAMATALSTAGTMVVEFDYAGAGSVAFSSNRVIAALNDGTGDERHMLYNRSGKVSGSYSVDTPSDLALNGPDIEVGAWVASKAAIAFINGDYGMAANGSLGSSGSLTVPTITSLHVGRFISASHFFGHIHSLKLYTRRLSDVDLQSVTS